MKIQSNHLATVLQHFQEPLEKMLETGFFEEPTYMIGGVPGATIRKIARRICGELRRPFISIEHVREYWTYNAALQRSEPNPDQPWLYAFISIPKRKRLMPLASPLLLASGDAQVRRWGQLTESPVESIEYATKWGFRISSRSFLDEYLETVFTDPDMRRALGLDPK